jgi:hypothetical protein
MKLAGVALGALLLVSQSVRMASEDRTSIMLVGTYLGNEMRPDGAAPDTSPLHRTYYVRTEEGTWSLVSSSDVVDVLARTLTTAPGHLRSDRPNLLDTLKRWEKFAFRAEPDRRIGVTRNSFVVYIPRTDDPGKADKFDADFVPNPAPGSASASNVDPACGEHPLTPGQEAQDCGNQ